MRLLSLALLTLYYACIFPYFFLTYLSSVISHENYPQISRTLQLKIIKHVLRKLHIRRILPIPFIQVNLIHHILIRNNLRVLNKTEIVLSSKTKLLINLNIFIITKSCLLYKESHNFPPSSILIICSLRTLSLETRLLLNIIP